MSEVDVFKFNQQDELPDENRNNNVYYTLMGLHTDLSPGKYPILSDGSHKDNQCFAYYDAKSNRYFIKYYRDREYHPVNNELSTVKLIDNGMDTMKYRPVPKEKFDNYIEFLKTKHDKFYRAAQRIVL